MRTLHRRWHSEIGGALVELAVALPVLVLVFVATVDFARVFYTANSLNAAARAGAQYGSHDPASSGDIPGMEATARDATNITGVTAIGSRQCRCVLETIGGPGTPGGVGPGIPAICNARTPCPGNSLILVVTVTVTTSKTFTTIMSGIPGIPGSVSLTRTATMRVIQ